MGFESLSGSMARIKTITISSIYRSIPSGFHLDLANFTAITGENNTGKTNFVEAIANKKASFVDDAGAQIEVIPVHVAAESIAGDEELKIGKTAEAFKTISELITVDPSFNLEDTEDARSVSRTLNEFTNAVNSKLDKLKSSGSGSSLRLNIPDSLSLKAFLQDILTFIPTDSISSRDHKKFDELGQGWQRLIIAAFLLTKWEANIGTNKAVLMMVEEPEVYLHPRLKRRFYSMLREVSEKEGCQVLITTHDPYLAAVSQDEGDGKSIVYSFTKNDTGMTNAPQQGAILGVEDELLHILLFTKALSKHGCSISQLDTLLKTRPSMVKRDYYDDRNPTVPIQHSLPVYVRHKIHHPNNPLNNFTEEDLIASIKMLNEILV